MDMCASRIGSDEKQTHRVFIWHIRQDVRAYLALVHEKDMRVRDR